MSVLQLRYILYTHRLANRIRSEKNIAIAPAASKKCHSFINSLVYYERSVEGSDFNDVSCLVYVLGDFFYRNCHCRLAFFGGYLVSQSP